MSRTKVVVAEEDRPQIDFESDGIIENPPGWLEQYEAEVVALKAAGQWPPPANDPWWLDF